MIYASLGKHNLLEFEGGQKRLLVAERAQVSLFFLSYFFLSFYPLFNQNTESKHEFFTSNTFENDIALLKLAQPVVFTDKIKPICLGNSTPLIGSTAIISGWVRQRPYFLI